jgi:hypothetical protein
VKPAAKVAEKAVDSHLAEEIAAEEEAAAPSSAEAAVKPAAKVAEKAVDSHLAEEIAAEEEAAAPSSAEAAVKPAAKVAEKAVDSHLAEEIAAEEATAPGREDSLSVLPADNASVKAKKSVAQDSDSDFNVDFSELGSVHDPAEAASLPANDSYKSVALEEEFEHIFEEGPGQADASAAVPVVKDGSAVGDDVYDVDF